MTRRPAPAVLILALGLLAAPLRAEKVVVLFTGDTQGRVSPRQLLSERASGGSPALLDIVQEERGRLDAGDDLVLLDSGDFLLGGVRTGTYDGEPAIRAMDLLGYTAAGLGNHEFDRHEGILRLRAAQASFPLVASNLYRHHTRFSPAPFRSSVLLELPHTGVRLGLVGVLSPDLVRTGPGSPHPGLTLGDPEEALVRELDRLRGQGAQLIVALTHQGVRADVAMVRRHPEIDLVLGGHSPSTRVEQRIGDTRVLQARAEGVEVGRVEVPVVDRKPRPGALQVQWLPWATRAARENPVEAMLREFPVGREVLARTERRFTFEETAAWILGAIQEASRSMALSPRLVCINRGSVRGSLPAGEVTVADLRRIAPFDNHLVHLELPASAVRSLLEPSPERPRQTPLLWQLSPGTTAEDLRNLPRETLVGVVTNDFLADGRDLFTEFLEARARRLLPGTVREAMQDSLHEVGASPLVPPLPLSLEFPGSPLPETSGGP